MKIYNNFISLYNEREKLPNQGWAYIKEEDFQDLENATFFLYKEDELNVDDYTETDDDIVPTTLYNKYCSICSLIENQTFKAIYENMDNLNKEFTLEEKIEDLYHYIEEDTFLY